MPSPEFSPAQLKRMAPYALGLLLVLAGSGTYLAWSRAQDDWASAMQSGRYPLAAKIMLAHAGDNDPALHRQLGNLYYLGLGIQRDYAKAARYYSMAAFAGDVAAQVNLGHLYNNGLGRPQDDQLAYAWFHFASAGGSDIAQDYMTKLLKEYKLSPHLVDQLNASYATLDAFPRLH